MNVVLELDTQAYSSDFRKLKNGSLYDFNSSTYFFVNVNYVFRFCPWEKCRPHAGRLGIYVLIVVFF